mgnify:CR=1 FL=1
MGFLYWAFRDGAYGTWGLWCLRGRLIAILCGLFHMVNANERINLVSVSVWSGLLCYASGSQNRRRVKRKLN